MGKLKDWRDAIKAKLVADVEDAKSVTGTSNPKISIENIPWDSPALFVEFGDLEGGESMLIGKTQQMVAVPVNIYAAVRMGTADNDAQTFEFNEEAVGEGTLDLLDAVLASLLDFTVGTDPVICKLKFSKAGVWATADEVTVWLFEFTLSGSYIAVYQP